MERYSYIVWPARSMLQSKSTRPKTLALLANLASNPAPAAPKPGSYNICLLLVLIVLFQLNLKIFYGKKFVFVYTLLCIKQIDGFFVLNFALKCVNII